MQNGDRIRRRFASRILVRDEHAAVLLMHFSHRSGALAGKNFWALPGGECEPGERFADCARRELFEETGVTLDSLDDELAIREFPFMLYDGEHVIAEEHFFSVELRRFTPKHDHLSDVEKDIVSEFRWWSPTEIRDSQELIYPSDLMELL